MLHDAREGGHRLGFVNALAHEEGRDQVIYRQAGLGHQAAQGDGSAQATGSRDGEAHPASLRRSGRGRRGRCPGDHGIQEAGDRVWIGFDSGESQFPRRRGADRPDAGGGRWQRGSGHVVVATDRRFRGEGDEMGGPGTGQHRRVHLGHHVAVGHDDVDLPTLGDKAVGQHVTAHLGAWLAAAYLRFPGGESRAEPYDEAEVSFSLRDSAGAELWSTASGKFDTLYWWPWREAVAVPPGTRSARVVVAANRRTLIGGTRNDGAIDEVFFGIEIRPRAHGRLGGNLLSNPGAESVDLDPWNVEGGFRHGANLARFFTDYLVTRSGDGMFMAYPTGEVEESTLSQVVELPEAAQYLRWGGRLKSFASLMGVGLRVEVLDAENNVACSAGTGELRCAQWESFSGVFRLPVGAIRARLIVTAGIRGRAAFADDLVLQALGARDGAPWFERGDVDRSGGLNITDAVVILQFLFAEPAGGGFCADAADVDDDGRIIALASDAVKRDLGNRRHPPAPASLQGRASSGGASPGESGLRPYA